jgi:histidinol phosphatase-like PHP family hydrolase
MKLKLDLHTHCYDALGLPDPSVEVVKNIIDTVKAKGLDGIAITEHYSKSHGLLSKEILDAHFPNEIIIIAGQETWYYGQEVVELYLEDGITFRFVAHPMSIYNFSKDKYKVQGIEIKNYLHRDEMHTEEILEIAKRENLLPLTNSDAHVLADVGKFYNYLDIKDLWTLAKADEP